MGDVLDRAEWMLGPAADVRTPRPGAVLDDPTRLLIETGWFTLQQLRIALGLTVAAADTGGLARDLIERAATYHGATPGAVGAAAAIADGVRCDDVRPLARTITEARRRFDDADLLAGVSALIASLAEAIGSSMALDPAVVLGELRRAGRTGLRFA